MRPGYWIRSLVSRSAAGAVVVVAGWPGAQLAPSPSRAAALDGTPWSTQGLLSQRVQVRAASRQATGADCALGGECLCPVAIDQEAVTDVLADVGLRHLIEEQMALADVSLLTRCEAGTMKRSQM